MLEVDESLDAGALTRAFGSADHTAGPATGILAGKLHSGTASSSRFGNHRRKIVRAVAGADGNTVLNVDIGQEALVSRVKLQLAA